MKETINSWLIQSDPYETSKIKCRKRANDHDYSGFRVRYCLVCKRVHENAYYAGEGSNTYYYLGFPTYGLRRETCKYCGKL